MENCSFITFLWCIHYNKLTLAEQQQRILLNDNIYSILSRLEALEKEVTVLKSDHDQMPRKTVAFMAYLTKTVTGNDRHVYFDDVKLNLGNAYNPHHGMFAVPVNGTYQFTVTACSLRAHFVILELTVNNANLGRVLAGDSAYSECSSNTFLAELQTGDDVYVQLVNDQGYLLAAATHGYPCFTGVLLQAN